MKDQSTRSLALPQRGENDFLGCVFHLHQQSNGEPVLELDNRLEATAGLKANISTHRSGTRLHLRLNEVERRELFPVSVAARTLIA